MYDNMRQHVITCDNLHFDSICFPCFLFLKGRLTTYQTDDDDNKLRVHADGDRGLADCFVCFRCGQGSTVNGGGSKNMSEISWRSSGSFTISMDEARYLNFFIGCWSLAVSFPQKTMATPTLMGV